MTDSAHFFIVGCPRSGTTLLSVLLDRHSRLCVPPETAFFDEVAPLLLDDRAVTDVLDNWPRLAELKIKPQEVVDRLCGRQSNPAAVLGAILDAYAAQQGKARCGEKTPQHLPHVPAILRLFPNATGFCIIRDGREVALSLAAMPWWAPWTLADAAKLWKQSAEMMVEFARAYPARFKVVRYEDLVAHLADVLARVMADLGERLEQQQFDASIASGVVLPRSAKWKGQAVQAITGEGIGRRWSQATAEQVLLLDRLLGADLNRHGY